MDANQNNLNEWLGTLHDDAKYGAEAFSSLPAPYDFHVTETDDEARCVALIWDRSGKVNARAPDCPLRVNTLPESHGTGRPMFTGREIREALAWKFPVEAA